MKRAISILLLLFLAVAAIRPTVAFHFCGGSLHSVGIGEAGRSCCGGAMDAETAGDASPVGATTLAEPVEPCCSAYTLEIATDSYQKPSVLPTATILHPLDFLPVPCFLRSLAEDYELPVLRLQTVFPSGLSTRYTSDRLTLICIWRK